MYIVQSMAHIYIICSSLYIHVILCNYDITGEHPMEGRVWNLEEKLEKIAKTRADFTQVEHFVWKCTGTHDSTSITIQPIHQCPTVHATTTSSTN